MLHYKPEPIIIKLEYGEVFTLWMHSLRMESCGAQYPLLWSVPHCQIIQCACSRKRQGERQK